jgi:murein DD-endopeptidase MepM/ murein hydrolase activator NlpD
VLAILVINTIVFPQKTEASILSSFTDKVKAVFVGKEEEAEDVTIQSLALFKPVINEDVLNAAEAGEDIDAESLQATSGSLRVSTEDIDFPTSDTISVYEVKKGDTLSTVAKLFGVSKNTIIWANDLKSQTISPGDTLVILPMTGIKHTVKKGDTVLSIAKKYKADTDDITKFNGIADDAPLTLGDTLLIPDGEIAVVATPSKSKASGAKSVIKTKILSTYSLTAPSGFLIRPVVGGRRTQGVHGHNGVDIASVPGTPILAAATGRVIVAKVGGYNGGYGNMIIMTHDGGIQTVYAHLRAVYVTSGQTITQGTVIGELGNTGRSTGPHLHFEVRGAKNPF